MKNEAKTLFVIRTLGRQLCLHPVRHDESPLAVFMARLPQAIGRRMVFFRLCDGERSFDETWLLNLFDAIMSADAERYTFAMRSRMSRAQAGALHVLACQAASRLDSPLRELSLSPKQAIAS
ncbi:hypothetical protein [Nereida sp. MMG025]|uniref:hypothetical protein n=1 Tax=Nereida sp. MMG025 TaxID=2909981 RepID=UPI001F237E3F|nr:hypothetical protein [Nereida sp. MMG025]MCF6445265.1 hypothetical protein [Nereida sp. MMG025]